MRDYKYCKVLSDVVEGAAGALFLDLGGDFPRAAEVLGRKLLPAIFDGVQLSAANKKDLKSVFLMWVQALGCSRVELVYSDAGGDSPLAKLTDCCIRIHGEAVAQAAGKNSGLALSGAVARLLGKLRLFLGAHGRPH